MNKIASLGLSVLVLSALACGDSSFPAPQGSISGGGEVGGHAAKAQAPVPVPMAVATVEDGQPLEDAKIGVDASGNLVVAWIGPSISQFGFLHKAVYARRYLSGSGWSAARRLSPPPPNDYYGPEPRDLLMAVDHSGRVLAVWKESEPITQHFSIKMAHFYWDADWEGAATIAAYDYDSSMPFWLPPGASMSLAVDGPSGRALLAWDQVTHSYPEYEVRTTWYLPAAGSWTTPVVYDGGIRSRPAACINAAGTGILTGLLNPNFSTPVAVRGDADGWEQEDVLLGLAVGPVRCALDAQGRGFVVYCAHSFYIQAYMTREAPGTGFEPVYIAGNGWNYWEFAGDRTMTDPDIMLYGQVPYPFYPNAVMTFIERTPEGDRLFATDVNPEAGFGHWMWTYPRSLGEEKDFVGRMAFAGNGNGTVVAAWEIDNPSDGKHLRAASFTPAGGWTASRWIDGFDGQGSITQPAVAINGAGTGVAVWNRYPTIWEMQIR